MIIIEQPQPVVWAYLMAIDNYVSWQSDLVSVEATYGLNTGSIIAFETVGMGQRLKIKAFVASNDGVSSFTVKSQRGPISFEARYLVQEHGSNTRLHLVNIIDTKSVFSLAAPLLQSMGDAKYDADLARLKAVLESTPQP